MLGARLSTHSHVIVGEDLLQLFPRFDGIWGDAREPVHYGWREHDGEIIRHDNGVSSGGMDDGGVSLQPLSWVHPSFIGLDPGDFETMGPLECSEHPSECWGPFWVVGADISSIASDDRLQIRVRITVLSLVLLAASYFIFMVLEATLINTPSCIPEVTEVHSGVLFDLLVVLAMMLTWWPLPPPWGGSDWSAHRL